MDWIPAHHPDDNCPLLDTDRGCYWCCDMCNHGEHRRYEDWAPMTHNGVLKVKA